MRVDPVQATTVDGAVIAADLAGPSSGTPVVLLAGQSLGPETFDEFRDDLAREVPVVVVHTRGTGRSSADGAEPWTTATFAADVVTVLDSLGIGTAHVHGFSMGGRVAQVLAARYPARVSRLVLGATGAGGALEVPRTADVDATLRRTARSGGRQALAELFFTPGWIARNSAVAARFAPQGPPRVQRLHHAASTTHAGADLLPEILAPTLVLHGADDALTPAANARVVAGLVPSSRVVELPGARHGYFCSERDVVVPMVLEHLAP